MQSLGGEAVGIMPASHDWRVLVQQSLQNRAVAADGSRSRSIADSTSSGTGA